MAWVSFVLLVGVAVLVITVPGAQVLWLLRVRDHRTVTWAPATGLGLLGALTVVASFLGHWSWAYVIVLGVVLSLAIALQARRHPRFVGPKIMRRGLSFNAWVIAASFAGVGAFVVAYLPPFIQLVMSPGLPQTLDSADAGFHLTGAKLVADSGNVNPLNALSGIRTPVAGVNVYYPTLWHAFVALLIPFASVGMSTNAAIFAVGTIFWPLSLSALAVAIAPSVRSAAFWAPMLGVSSMLFPGSIMFRWSMDPFGLSMPLVVTALAMAVWWMRNRKGSTVSPFVLVFLGAILAQPSSALLIAVIPVVVLVTSLTWNCGTALMRLRWGTALVNAVGLSLVVALGVFVVKLVVRTPYVLNLGNFQRGEVGYRGSLVLLARGGPTYPETHMGFLPFSVILVVGALWSLWLLRSQAGFVFSGTALSFLFLYMASSGPETVLRLLTGPWYKDYTRLAVPVIAVLAVAAGAAVATGLEQLFRRRLVVAPVATAGLGVLGVVALMISPLLGWSGTKGSIRHAIEEGYDLELDEDTVLSEDAALLLQSLGDALPKGTYILGSPSSGAPFAVAFTDQFGFTRWVTDPAVSYLGAHLDKIHVDAKVCEAIEDADVSAVLVTDVPGSEAEMKSYEGFYNVDLSDGFELVAKRDDLRLYRITACD